jgi:hypothetical protein
MNTSDALLHLTTWFSSLCLSTINICDNVFQDSYSVIGKYLGGFLAILVSLAVWNQEVHLDSLYAFSRSQHYGSVRVAS